VSLQCVRENYFSTPFRILYNLIRESYLLLNSQNLMSLPEKINWINLAHINPYYYL
jgi:hypothetical protein